MEKNLRPKPSKTAAVRPTAEQLREAEARKKLARPPKDKTEITIGPTVRTGPDVVLE